MKKILLFSDKWGNGGIESFVMNVIRCLDNTKYNITLVCAKKITDLYDDELKEKNIKTIELLSKGGNSPGMRRIEALKRFKALIANNNFDIAHFNICNSVDMFYAYISKKNKIKKIIVHSHNSGISGKWRKLKILMHKIWKKIFYNVPTDYVACSGEAAKWMFDKSKLNIVQIINNSINVEKYKFDINKRNIIRKGLNIGQDTYVIGNIARFSKEKNHRFLIEVFENINKKNKNTKLLLVGNGELKDEVENLVKDKGLSDKVIFYGITQDVPGILSVMDCFVLPSIFEGKPVVSIEEQVSGLYGIYSNTITKEVKLTNLIEYIDLNESKEFWANEILEKQKYVSNRKSMDKVIEEKGYGLESLRGNLERIYNR